MIDLLNSNDEYHLTVISMMNSKKLIFLFIANTFLFSISIANSIMLVHYY